MLSVLLSWCVLTALPVSVPPLSQTSGVAAGERRDTSLTSDTTPPLLTAELLARMEHLLAELRQQPTVLRTLSQDSANLVHFRIQNAPFSDIWSDTLSDTGAVLDYGRAAAKVPAVAAAFQHAHLAPAHYLPILKALTFAEATDTLRIALEGVQDDPVSVVDPQQVIWRNVAFLRAHRAAIDALGLTLPTMTFQYNGVAVWHFLDTVALAQHIYRLREVTDTSAGFPIGFMDSSDAPAQGAARSLAPPLRVLFIGNSLTYFNEMPRLFSALAASGLHRRVVVGLVSLPSASPFELWTTTDVRQVIAHLPWDAIVVQLKPVGSNTPPTFQRYARLFAQEAAAHHARAVFWTQYRAPDDAQDVQTTLNRTVATAATTVHASVVPMPAAWDAVHQADDSTWHALFYDLAHDNTHPSPVGSYLMALVFYRALAGQSPLGLPSQAGAVTLPQHEAALLQQAAAAAQP